MTKNKTKKSFIHYLKFILKKDPEGFEQSDTLLNTSEIEFLEKFSTGNENLKAIFSIYENKRYLDKGKYEEFLSLKAEMMLYYITRDNPHS
ncbi:hypothetical protein LCGC14_1213420 [marine sediment metagenome]|uniref:RGS domain-containing protein n=1 Tax=marine sediment metagenome TaxID=412755 RepID=A0A0F9NVP3_9ZZZZ